MGKRRRREIGERDNCSRQRHALTLRLLPIPADTLASELRLCCAASISLTSDVPSSAFMRIKPHGDAEVHHAGLRAEKSPGAPCPKTV
jgi:hypothetical protein